MARPVKIPQNLHVRLAELDLCGWAPAQIQSWLAAHYNIGAAVDTITKVLRRVRITPPTDDTGGGLTDFIAARAALRADLLAADWRARQGAVARLIDLRRLELEIEERRAAGQATSAPAKAYSVAASPDDFPDPQETPQDAPGGAEGAG